MHELEAVPADGFGKEVHGCSLVALLHEEEINGLAALIDGAMPIVPLAFDLDVGLVQAPADPHRVLAAMEHRLQLGAVLQEPAIDHRIVNGHPTCLPQLFHLAVAQRVGHVPPHARQDNIFHKALPP